MTDVIVIGGGIAGCSAAYYLARDGADVVLIEQFDLNTMASGSNAGSLHAQIQPEAFADLGEDWAREFLPAVPFYTCSMALWAAAEAELGTDLGVVQDGGLTVAHTDADLQLIAAKVDIERAAGLPIEVLSRSELRDAAPYVTESALGAAFCPIEGKADPLVAATAFAAAAEQLGADIRRGSEVLGLKRSAAGFDVATTTGSFNARRIVNAAGMHADRIASMLGINLAIKSFPIQLCVTEALPDAIGHLVYATSAPLTLKQTHGGTVLIGGGWPATIGASGHAEVSSHSLRANIELALQTVPMLAKAKIVRTWAAMVNGNRSWLPLLGEAPGQPGFFLNYVPWMGLSGALAASTIVASLVQGKQPPVDFDISPFAP